MYSMKVYVAYVGHQLSDGTRSDVGHMWYSLIDENGNEFSYGFNPKTEGVPWGDGKVSTTDTERYPNPPKSYEVTLTREQFDRAVSFSEKALRDSAAGIGRWAEYQGLTNSCVDFTWQALYVAGVSDTPEAGWQGVFFPYFNVRYLDQMFGDVNPSTNDWYNSARNWILRKDPLTLDLDGDGLETVGIDPLNPILFDHDGDGIKNATGWIKPDDGFLVLDRNGNGLIDNGTELFGDSTPAYAGGKTVDGFAALAQEDTNHDGLVNASDANWSELRVWRDLNSDGVTDEGELLTLESLGIAGFHVAKTENSKRLANGNEIARTKGTGVDFFLMNRN